jgi:cellobiose phosphorylase
MGCGDWNDGMNLVGQNGQGESVWLAFFQFDVLTQFAKLAHQQNDTVTGDRLVVEAGRLRGHIEHNAGTVNGIVEHTLTMELRWVRRRTTNARSIRSPKAGQFFPVPALRRDLCRQWPVSIDVLCD